MICPFCQQDEIVEAYVVKTKQYISICPECDTVWIGQVTEESGIGFKKYMKKYGLDNSWDELKLKNAGDGFCDAKER